MTARRSFLEKVGATGLATVAAIAAVPTPPTSPVTVEGMPDEEAIGATELPWPDDPITDEDATPIARYQYRATGNGYEPTSPINVVFPLADRTAGLSAVMGVLEAAGWTTELEEYTRYAWDREAGAYVLQQATAAETYFGASGRVHVRCWEFEGVVSMQVHEDSPARPKHVVTSYARGRRIVESVFRAAGWTVLSAAVDLENGGSSDHDGFASIVVPGDAETTAATGDGDDATATSEGSA